LYIGCHLEIRIPDFKGKRAFPDGHRTQIPFRVLEESTESIDCQIVESDGWMCFIDEDACRNIQALSTSLINITVRDVIGVARTLFDGDQNSLF
jgi:hypothetical protein